MSSSFCLVRLRSSGYHDGADAASLTSKARAVVLSKEMRSPAIAMERHGRRCRSLGAMLKTMQEGYVCLQLDLLLLLLLLWMIRSIWRRP